MGSHVARSTGFPRQILECCYFFSWAPNPGIEPSSPVSPALQANSLITEPHPFQFNPGSSLLGIHLRLLYANKILYIGTSSVVQQLRLHAPNAGGKGLLPGQGTNILHASVLKNTCTWMYVITLSLIAKHWLYQKSFNRSTVKQCINISLETILDMTKLQRWKTGHQGTGRGLGVGCQYKG